MKKSLFSIDPPVHQRKWYNIWIAAIFWIATILFVTVTNAFAQPAISSVSPLSGMPGSTVTITGTGFNATPANDIVYFGATRAAVTGASGTSLTVTVPAGATFDYVTVNNTATGRTAYSGRAFLPTYNNTGFVPGTENFDPGILLQDTANTTDGRAIVDIDGDGKPDVVILKVHNALAVYRNTSSAGSVSFAAPVYFTTGHNPYSIAVGDLDGDGKPDLAVGDLDDNAVSVFRNTSSIGSVSLGTRVAFPCVGSGNPFAIAIGDVDGDGRPEVVAGSPDPLHTIQVFRNTSSPGGITTGSFATVVTYATAGQLEDVVVCDIDGDGKTDISYTNVGGSVSVMRNTSSVGTIDAGSFAGEVTFAAGTHCLGMAARDIDGDGKPDLLVANYFDSTISILRNTSVSGSINSSSFAAQVTFHTSDAPVKIGVGDMDGDGKPDIAVSNSDFFHTICLFHNAATPGTITSASLMTRTLLAYGSDFLYCSLADMNGDGKPDIITKAFQGFYVLKNTPYTFVSPITGPSTVCIGTTFHMADTTAGGTWTSGNPGVATIGSADGIASAVSIGTTTITYTFGSGYTVTKTVTVTTVGSIPVVTSVSPLKGNVGAPVTIAGTGFSPGDVVYFGATRASVSSSTGAVLNVTVPAGATYEPVTVIEPGCGSMSASGAPFLPTYDNSNFSPGTFNFDTAVSFTDGITNYDQPSDIVIGDLDGDGKADIVSVQQMGVSVFVYRNTSVGETITSSSFAAPLILALPGSSYGNQAKIADMDMDGKPDLVVSTWWGVYIFRNTSTPGSISFALIEFFEGPTQNIAIGDIDGDGKPDIAGSNYGGGSGLSILQNNSSPGSLSFPFSTSISTGLLPFGIVMGDIDGDGKPDLCVNITGVNVISVFLNTSSGSAISFSGEYNTSVGSIYGNNISIGDLDGDGKADIVVPTWQYLDSTTILRNTSSVGLPSFTSCHLQVSPSATNRSTATIADFDGDGKPDLGIIGAYGIEVYHNNCSPGAITTNAFPLTVFLQYPGNNLASITAGDLDGDGKPEIVGVQNQPTYGGIPYFSVYKNDPYRKPPVVTAVSPLIDSPGTSVTITGANFNSTPGNDVVHFGATKATVTAASTTALSVSVPQGAINAPVSVLDATTRLSGSSAQPFLPTYDGSAFLPGTANFDSAASFVHGDTISAIGDIDGDGKADIVTIGGTGIRIYRNISISGSLTTSSFASPVTVPMPAGAAALALGDMNGDGKPDIVVVNNITDSVYVFSNTSFPGTPSFSIPDTFPSLDPQTTKLIVGDIDGDGRQDIVTCGFSTGYVWVYYNTTMNGAFSIYWGVMYPFVSSDGAVWSDIALADVDGDNKPELLIGALAPFEVVVYKNTSVPHAFNFLNEFDPTPVILPVSDAFCLAIQDMDGDGKQDIITSGSVSHSVSVLRNTSTPGVISTAPEVVFTDSFMTDMAVADIDGDSKPDVITTTWTTNNFSVLRNNSTSGTIGTGSFTKLVVSGADSLYSNPRLSIGDLDGDGKPDLVACDGTKMIVRRNHPLSEVPPIMGYPGACIGVPLQLSDVLDGGTWSSTTPAIATVGSTGEVLGLAEGTATISYTIGILAATVVVTVNIAPGPILGPMWLYTDSTITLNDTVAGGVWSTASSVAGISAAGVVTGLAPGTAVISYAMPSGCAITTTITVVSSSALPGSLRSGIVSTYAPFSPDYQTVGLVVDSSNNIFVADAVTSTVKKISRSGVVTVVAGNGTAGYSGDGGLALAAQLSSPAALAMDTHGNLYVADVSNYVVRKINTSGIITTVAGSTWGYSSGDGGPATAATLAAIPNITVDKRGNLYISDDVNSNIRKVDTSGIISTIAGFPGAGGGPITGFSGDGGPATNALLNSPMQITVDAHQNVYFFDRFNYRIRKIDSMGIISTIAGNGTEGYSGDWGPASLASIGWCAGLKADPAGNVYLTGGIDYEHIRKINPGGIIMTIAGDTIGYSGDGGPAILASFDATGAFDFDKYGNMFVVDYFNQVIREIKYHADEFADSFSVFIDNHCGALNFSTETGPTSATALSTDFGDGTNTTTALSPGDPGTMYANVPHVYSAPGTYSVKEVLWNGTTAVDSILFSHQYLLCNNLAVQFYYDNNGNCLKDADESSSFPPVTVEIDSNGVAVDTQTATSGIYYSAFGGPGDIYSFKVISAPPGLVPACSGSGIVYDTLQSIIYHVSNNYIGFACSGTAGIDLAANANFIAGRHSAGGTIIVNNNYCTPQAGVVTLSINPKYFFESSVPAPSSVSGNTVTWNTSALSSMWAPQTIHYTLNRTAAWLIPGDTILSVVKITPVSGDADTTNNTVIRIDTVKTSYDPNEISVIPDGDILPGTWLQYTINFENTGNDTAFNIAVVDTLPDNLDINTLRIDAATAVMNTAIYSAGGHNIVKFDFPNINLLDSSHHNQCDGMVIFHIKPKNGLADGATMYNHAGIFFDDNPVVMTDTAENVISLIHGPNSVCIGSRVVMTDVPELGIWTLSNAHATVVDDTVTGVTAGVDTLTYTTTTKYGSASVTKIVTVNASPAPITGPSSMCEGGSVALSDATPAVSWSSSNGNATIGSTGIVTGISAGTVTITCGVSSGCIATMVLTVNPVPMPITGTALACSGASTTLTDATAAGTWSSSNPAVATVGSTGIVTGVSAGATNIAYTLASGCSANLVATITAAPSSISGSSFVCTGSTSSLSDALAGGIWSSSNAAVAAVGSTGVVGGISMGTATVTYVMATGCFATKPVTVNPSPAAILGITSACSGASTTLSNTTAGGFWISSNTAVATAGTTGVITGVSAGTTRISYIIASGCFANVGVTISPMPSVISGSTAICAGSSSSVSDAVGGGTWSSSSTGVATIGASSGVVTGITTGTANISYKMSPGCFVNMVVTVNLQPAAISGSHAVCNGSSSSLSDATAGGTWSSSSSVATIGSGGTVTGVSAGTTYISYTLASGCFTSTIVTVNPLPSTISGTLAICLGTSSPLSDAMGGGTWSSGNTVVATAGSGTGIVTGVGTGTSNITYTLGTGCFTNSVVTVNPLPAAITGTMSLCASGGTTTLSDATPGGSWSSPDVTVDATGTVTGAAAGTGRITYTLPTGCYAAALVTVNAIPAAIAGTPTICMGFTTLLSDATIGGTWSSGTPGIAVTGPGGLVSGFAAGTATITYTAGSGCIATQVVTVNPTPSPISGSLSVCLGATSALTDAVGGGTWSSNNSTIASVGSSSGIVSGNSVGTVVISYITGGCATSSIVTVDPSPVSITGTAMECMGSSTALSDASAGGNWSTSSAAVATVDAGGIVTGVSAGTAVITYMLPSGCYVTVVNTVNPAPSAIANPGLLCVGTSAALSGAPSGGTWMSDATGIAAIGTTGEVTGITTGTANITYTLLGGCYTALAVTVNSTPGIITGATTLCVGGNTDLNDIYPGGTWSSSTPGIATVSTIGASTGVVIGISAGVDTISYIVSPGCVAYSLMTVYPLPTVTATAASSGCGGKYDLAASGALLYNWSPSAGLACATCASNIVNPVATTTYTVVGTSVFGCRASATATVNGNRILGHITAGGLPTDTVKVWLMQINPADSSVIATDSVLTCMDDGIPYYEFDGKAAGSYLVRVKLPGSVPGVTGYVPTYGASSPYWDAAVSISHTSATDTQHIHMVHGVVPSGSGSISGLIISGAGRGTSGGAPAVGMLVYVLNSSDQVLTYTYTDATGAYSFSGLANGSYIVYPEEYKYYTTPSALVTLATGSEAATDVNFKQHTSLGTITPYSNVKVSALSVDNGMSIYPNPASGVLNVQWAQQAAGNAAVVITDLVGREVYSTAMDMTVAPGKAQLDISTLKEGVYIITIRSGGISFNCKLVVQ